MFDIIQYMMYKILDYQMLQQRVILIYSTVRLVDSMFDDNALSLTECSGGNGRQRLVSVGPVRFRSAFPSKMVMLSIVSKQLQ